MAHARVVRVRDAAPQLGQEFGALGRTRRAVVDLGDGEDRLLKGFLSNRLTASAGVFSPLLFGDRHRILRSEVVAQRLGELDTQQDV